MNIIQSLHVIDAHTTGSPVRVVVGGVPHLPGATVSDKMAYMSAHYDQLRKLLSRPPRGLPSVVCAILTEPTVAGADFGLFFADAFLYHPMCGAGTMATAKCVVESGMVPHNPPSTRVTFDTGAGLVKVDVEEKADGTTTVALINAPAFIYQKDARIQVDGLGNLAFDVCFGGNFFALLDVKQLDLRITPQTLPRLQQQMQRILPVINEHISIAHPLNPAINYLDQILFIEEEADEEGCFLGQTIFGRDQIDYSPCGTGTSCRVAQRFFAGKLALGETFVHKQVFGGKFMATALAETAVGGIPAITAQISCADVHICGFNHFVLEKADRLNEGLLV